MRNKFGKRRGFTLSEVMIALAVFGVLCAAVTPVVFRVLPNNNKMLMKKAYYGAEEIVNSLINDRNLYLDCTVCSVNCTQKYHGFDDTRAVTYQGVSYSGNAKFPRLFASKLNIKSDDGAYKFTTTDGISWDFSDFNNAGHVWLYAATPKTSGAPFILVDINGAAAPNVTTGKTADRFYIYVCANGKMYTKDAFALEAITPGANLTGGAGSVTGSDQCTRGAAVSNACQ